jgi:hypothetical protein
MTETRTLAIEYLFLPALRHVVQLGRLQHFQAPWQKDQKNSQTKKQKI